MIMSLICIIKNTIHFHLNGFAPGLVLKPRQTANRKWAIDGFHCAQHFVAVSRMLLMGCKCGLDLKMCLHVFAMSLNQGKMFLEEFKINDIVTCFNV